ncbi:MAG: hypothetical protein BWZ08_01303 [candidate division BRC1 bacterium ADurb.BinA292]|nr:MAG: hypothetical protein BWZ08_01303 [candidate division BRC1 bacterium ADurb.BinA292]
MAMTWHHFKQAAIAFHVVWVVIVVAILGLLAGSLDLLDRNGQIIFAANFCAGALIGAGLYFYRVYFGLYYSIVFIAVWATAWCLLLLVSGRASVGAMVVIPAAALTWIAVVLAAFKRDQMTRRTELR